MDRADDILESVIGEVLAFDLNSPYLAIGTLVGFDHRYLILEQVDIHDMRDSKTSREKYLLESREFGVRPNRLKAYVNRQEIVSFSLLKDIVVE
jgi:hypothetical protein